MASSAELAILLTADDRTGKGFGSVNSRLGGLTRAIGAPVRAVGGLVTSLGRIGLAGLGITALSGAFQGLVGDAIEAQKVQAQLNAVIKSTGGIAGVTADMVNETADSLANLTGIEDDVIIGAQNLLLTFTNIGKDVFPDVTKTALDLSVALGTDLESAAMMMGKALNDPVKGLTALGKAGVQFTAEQKKVIKSLVETGDVAAAQAMILEEVNKQVGGSAEAFGTTFAGKLGIFNNALGNVKEIIGNIVLPALTDLMTGLSPLINTFADNLPGIIETVKQKFTDLTQPIRDIIAYLDPNNTYDLMGALFGPDFGPIIDEGVRLVKELGKAVGEIAETIVGFVTGEYDFGDVLGEIGAALSEIKMPDFAGIFGNVSDLATGLFTTITEAVAAVDWPGVWATLQTAAGGVLAFVTGLAGDAAGLAVALWARLVNAFQSVDWPGVWEAVKTAAGNVLGFVTGLLGEASELANALWARILNAVQQIEWDSVWASVQTGAAALQIEVEKLWAGLDWEAIGAVAAKAGSDEIVVQLAAEIKQEDFTPVGQAIGSSLIAILVGPIALVVKFISDELSKEDAVSTVSTGAINMLIDVWNTVSSSVAVADAIIDSIKELVAGMAKALDDNLGPMKTAAENAGVAIIDSLTLGMWSKLGDIVAMATELANAALAEFNRIFGGGTGSSATSTGGGGDRGFNATMSSSGYSAAGYSAAGQGGSGWPSTFNYNVYTTAAPNARADYQMARALAGVR